MWLNGIKWNKINIIRTASDRASSLSHVRLAELNKRNELASNQIPTKIDESNHAETSSVAVNASHYVPDG